MNHYRYRNDGSHCVALISYNSTFFIEMFFFLASLGRMSDGLKTTDLVRLTVDLRCVGTSLPDGSGSARLMLDTANLKKIQIFLIWLSIRET